MEPVKSNIQSKNCDAPIGSDCVTWSGGGQYCNGTSITQVINSLSGIDAPCYTGNWIDFSSGIPTSGVSPGGSLLTSINWTLGFFGNALDGIIKEDTPQYKWTKDGNLSLRGSMYLQFDPFVGVAVFLVPLCTISTNCFPLNFKAQSHFIGEDIVNIQVSNFSLEAKYYVRIEPSGVLNLYVSIRSLIPTASGYFLGLGGVTFNLA